MRGTGSHTRVTPLGSVTSTFVVTSNVRQPAGAVDAPARRANDGTPTTAPAAGRVIDLRNVRRSMRPPLLVRLEAIDIPRQCKLAESISCRRLDRSRRCAVRD